jgi:hypothetical protein
LSKGKWRRSHFATVPFALSILALAGLVIGPFLRWRQVAPKAFPLGVRRAQKKGFMMKPFA